MKAPFNQRFIAVITLVAAACTGPDSVPPPAPNPFACEVSQPAPYASPSPYAGVHAGPANNDLVPCDLADAWELSWTALEGYGLVQPNTYSPDGSATYATTLARTEGGCTVHAIDVADGAVVWCQSYPFAAGGSVEVDEDGMLYLSATDAVVSLDPAGAERWSTPIPQPDDPEQVNGAIGIHFTPGGHVVTVTNAGVVMLLARADGAVLATLDIPAVYGFVPASGAAPDISSLYPDYIKEDVASFYHGNVSEFFGFFLGTGANFSDNTVAVSPAGDVYVIGGGVDADTGAMVQIRVEGGPAAPTLAAGWALHIRGGSATTPAISPDGRWVRISDGSSVENLLQPGAVPATIRIADSEAGDDHRDSDPDPAVCGATYAIPIVSGAQAGATPVLDDAVHYLYETRVMDLADQTVSDVKAYKGAQLLWETTLPGDRVWSSVMTLTNDAIVGTMTAVTQSDETLLTVALPATAESELVVLDLTTGDIRVRAPVSEDSAATVTVGPDGSLYVGMLGLITVLARDTRPAGGLARYTPIN